MGPSDFTRRRNEVCVYTYPDCGQPEAPFEQLPVLTGKLSEDGRRLATARVDVWLALNAGLVPLAARIDTPFFAYFHGNDFLDPWIPYGFSPLERFERPYAAKLRHGLRRAAIRRALGSVRRILTNSHNTAGLIEDRLAVPHQQISVCPPRVDGAFFQRKRSGVGDRL